MSTKHASAFFVVALFLGIVGFVGAQDVEQNAPARKIVVFKTGTPEGEKSRALARAKGVRVKTLRHRDAVVAQLDQDAEARLAENPHVVRIEEDVVVEALETAAANQNQKAKSSSRNATQPAQVLPWGVDRIDAEQVWPLGETGTGINVGVIDTGISASHPDLQANIKGGVSEVWYTASWNDDNGHGSHVAGTVGAINNSIGVIGGAPAVNLFAIKVLDRRGSGYLSDVIDGIDWAIANGMHAINLSLGTSSDIQSFHDAIIRAYNAGIITVAAAGNSGGSVSYPAAYPEAIAVAATDSSNTAPYWSSRGPEVDLAAPGVSIYSTYKGTKYATLSGTSMAAPHVTASASFVLKRAPDTEFDLAGNCVSVYDTNCNAKWDPNEVQAKLQDAAFDLGAAGRDDIYGHGLVNAFAAFTP